MALGQASNSDKVMAGFLMHFTGYTTWPETDLKEITICLVGNVSFDGFIKNMIKARPKNRLGQRIKLVQLNKIDALKACHIAFVADNVTQAVINYRKSSALPILLVSAANNFIEHGGMVRFFKQNNSMRFEVNVTQLLQANLKMSAEVLKLAVISKQSSQEVLP